MKHPEREILTDDLETSTDLTVADFNGVARGFVFFCCPKRLVARGAFLSAPTPQMPRSTLPIGRFPIGFSTTMGEGMMKTAIGSAHCAKQITITTMLQLGSHAPHLVASWTCRHDAVGYDPEKTLTESGHGLW